METVHVLRLQIRYDHYDIITFRVSYRIFRKGGGGGFSKGGGGIFERGGGIFERGEVPESLHFPLNSSRNLQYSNTIVHLHTMYVT